MSKERDQDVDSLKQTCTELKTALATHYDSQVLNLQTHATTHVNKLQELIQNIPNNMEHSRKSHMEYFNINDKVLYTDDTTGQECTATVVDIHDEDDESLHYTVNFSTGKHQRTAKNTLKRPPSAQAPMCNRFDRVDRSFLDTEPPPVTSSTVIPPDSESKTSSILEPTVYDIQSFLTQFKAPLKSDDDIIIFYLQLKSQGETYNIHLIDITEVQPDKDLCPTGISQAARKKISLAIFQKIQDENTRDATYTELQHIMEQLSRTSDGYEALLELLRRVHPNLDDEHEEYESRKLSQCDYNLYTLNKHLRNYFTQEEINGRPYGAKEKSKIYLDSLDDDTYKDARVQCLLDLNIAHFFKKS